MPRAPRYSSRTYYSNSTPQQRPGRFHVANRELGRPGQRLELVKHSGRRDAPHDSALHADAVRAAPHRVADVVDARRFAVLPGRQTRQGNRQIGPTTEGLPEHGGFERRAVVRGSDDLPRIVDVLGAGMAAGWEQRQARQLVAPFGIQIAA
jgi:hypothetical protein